MDEQHRISLTEEHFHLARRFMVTNRLRSTRIAVQKMIEIVADQEEGKETTTTREGSTIDRKR